MTTTRDFEAELRAACVTDRTPGATLAKRAAAADLIESILEEADAAGLDLYRRFYDIDEAVRLSLIPVHYVLGDDPSVTYPLVLPCTGKGCSLCTRVITS